jgi:hypothetical protein
MCIFFVILFVNFASCTDRVFPAGETKLGANGRRVARRHACSHVTCARTRPAKKGDCTTKNIYRTLMSQVQVQLPTTTTGSRSILPQANQILQRTWKLKTLPPLIKTFAWRLIRRALATGSRASRFSQHIDEHCTYCGILETDAHLFFHCDFARAVWFSATPPLRTDNLPIEDDGV